ncbi:non-homologous end joining protein Ku [Actinacidiphila paucisporea]|uniref:DNA end-binding protein Ku n=1 Tax=Actinacidiphila paucisporea TaxID=310782 RepID=A0A1M7QZI9_9ACTN|nr:Ku protein [Actinacidiphila paucisporea]SHN37560.1 DNA end-binding protein Ku [Actinacidiphila paucisporea]
MPAIWSGTLTFGLVAIPVQVVAAVHSHKVAFRQIHLDDRGRVRNRKVCELEMDQAHGPHALAPDEIGRAYEAPDGTLVPISDQELDNLPLPTAKTVEISGFTDLGSIPGEQFGVPYFLAPQTPAANKPYVLMREALTRAGKGAIGKMAFRGTGETLAVIHAQGEVLVLHRLHWPDELRAADDAAPREDVELSEDEVQAALDYIGVLSDIDMDQMHDDYAAAVRDLIDAKAADKAPPAPEREDREKAGVTDLMTALQRATEQARADRGEDAEVHPIDGDQKTAQKAPAKRGTAKKAPKKTAAKKTTRKRAG